MHRDGFLDERGRAEEALAQLQADAVRSELSVWDASDGARPGEAADAPHPRQALLAVGDAGKSADPERVVRARGASFLLELRLALLVLAEQDAVVEPYRPDVARSGEQSCAAQVVAARQQPKERLDAECSASRGVLKRSLTMQAQVE